MGIGANTAIFTIIDASLLRGLPYQDPERLFHLWESRSQKEFTIREASYPDFVDWRQNKTFSGMTAYAGCSLILENDKGREPIQCVRVAADFFSVLGVKPLLGRSFLKGEDISGAPNVVMLEYESWQRRFGGDPKIVGRTIRMNGAAWTVIGILPSTFHFPSRSPEMWCPLIPSQVELTNRRPHWVNVLGRLKFDSTIEQAHADMHNITEGIAKHFPDTDSGTDIKIVPLKEEFLGKIKPVLLALQLSVGLVLLIACANIAGLQFVRSSERRKEIAIRLALGSRSSRIIRQLFVESMILAIIGGLFGLLVADVGIRILTSPIPGMPMPYLQGISMDYRIMMFNFGVTLLTGVLFGLLPAFRVSRLPLTEIIIKEGGKNTRSRELKQSQRTLIVVEIAIAFILSIGAGLMLKSLQRLLDVNPGFNPDNLASISLTVSGLKKYEDETVRATLHQQLLTHLESLPEVMGAGSVDLVPLVGGNTTRFYSADRHEPIPGMDDEANMRLVSSNYFKVMEIPLVKGRHFDVNDRKGAPEVIIVNKALAEKVFPNENAIGKNIIISGTKTTYQIIGVVGNELVNGFVESAKPVIYWTYIQNPDNTIVIMLRTKSDPMMSLEAIRREILKIDPGLVIYYARPLDQILSSRPWMAFIRYPAILLGIFALVSLFLVTIGVYGITSSIARQRTHEIGIRTALGTQRSNILKMILKEGMLITLLGVVCGLLGSLALSAMMQEMLFQVSVTDPLICFSFALLLAVIALLASYVPARRASKVDPMTVLREE